MEARIYQPAKTAVSSGRFKTKKWVVEFEPRSPKLPDRLVGWVGSDDTNQQVRLFFPSREAAIAFCERHGLAYTVDEPHRPIVKPKSYAENFIRRT